MALLSHATIGQTMLAAYNLHLESRGGDDLRRSQLADVLNETLGYGLDVPVIVAGDFNFDVTRLKPAMHAPMRGDFRIHSRICDCAQRDRVRSHGAV